MQYKIWSAFPKCIEKIHTTNLVCTETETTNVKRYLISLSIQNFSFYTLWIETLLNLRKKHQIFRRVQRPRRFSVTDFHENFHREKNSRLHDIICNYIHMYRNIFYESFHFTKENYVFSKKNNFSFFLIFTQFE